MWLYYLLKSMSWIISHLPYKLVVKIGLGLGRLYYIIAKKQRIRAEETIKERLGYSDEQAKATIRSLFIKLGATFMEIMYMPALNKNNIRGLVTFDRPDVLWEALGEGKGVVMLACHMDNWEWLGAALALSGFPLSAVEKPQPNHIYSDFMNELRKGVGQEIFSRGTSEILGCARAMKKKTHAGAYCRPGRRLRRYFCSVPRQNGFNADRACLFFQKVQSADCADIYCAQGGQLRASGDC